MILQSNDWSKLTNSNKIIRSPEFEHIKLYFCHLHLVSTLTYYPKCTFVSDRYDILISLRKYLRYLKYYCEAFQTEISQSIIINYGHAINRLSSYIVMSFEGAKKSEVFVICVFTITANSPQLLNLSIAEQSPRWNNFSHSNVFFQKTGSLGPKQIDKEIRSTDLNGSEVLLS